MLTHGEGAPNKLEKNPALKLLSLSYLVSGGVGGVGRSVVKSTLMFCTSIGRFPHGLMALLPELVVGMQSRLFLP